MQLFTVRMYLAKVFISVFSHIKTATHRGYYRSVQTMRLTRAEKIRLNDPTLTRHDVVTTPLTASPLF